jgi:hypothetical protein
VNDLSAAISKIVSDRYRAMTPADRWLVMSSLSECARKIIKSLLPKGLTVEQRHLAMVRRLYQDVLPEAAFIAHAKCVP